MDFNQIARELIPLLGGKENIASAAHCATRWSMTRLPINRLSARSRV